MRDFLQFLIQDHQRVNGLGQAMDWVILIGIVALVVFLIAMTVKSFV